MLFSYNWLKDYLQYNLTSAQIKQLLMTYSPLEVESIKKYKDDVIFDIKILANRMSDCASHFGIAREINILAQNRGFKKIPIKAQPNFKILRFSPLRTADFVDIIIESEKDCLRYGGLLFELSKNPQTPEFIKKRLAAVGVKPINPVVDISNYVMIDSGQPTHAFDFDKLFSSQKKKKIIIRRAKNGEKIDALDGKTYSLNSKILVIADEKKPLAIAGIKGGSASAITEKTKTIFLEYALFNPSLIYQASKELALVSDASLRFSHGVLIDSMARSVQLFKKISSSFEIAYPYRSEVIAGSYRESTNKILVKKDYFNERLSLNLKNSQVKDILKSLGCKITEKDNLFEVKTPSYRPDLKIKEDLVEEVGRIYGFNLVPSEFLIGAIIPKAENLQLKKEEEIKNILIFNSFDEVYSSSLLSENDLKYFADKVKNSLKLKNALSREHEYLRPSLLPGLLKIISKNDDNFQTIKIFEIGKIFLPERKSLAIVSYNEKRNFSTLSEFVDFYLIKKIIKDIFERFKVGELEIKSAPPLNKYQNNLFDRPFDILLKGKKIGEIGYLKKDVLKSLDIKNKVAACEIDLDLLPFKKNFLSFKELSEFPRIARDISFFVPEGVFYQDIEKTLKSIKIRFLEDFSLIDVYQKQDGNGLLSLTIRFIFRHHKRTLKDQEVNKEKEKIEKLLVEKFKVAIR